MDSKHSAQSTAVAVRPFTAQTAALLLATAGAWLVTLLQARRMELMPGSVPPILPAFVGMWAVMMAAMMLPSVAPLASMYARSISSRRWAGLASFAAGYLAVWAAARRRCAVTLKASVRAQPGRRWCDPGQSEYLEVVAIRQ